MVYGDVNMTDVDFVKETKMVVLWRWLLANHSRTDAYKKLTLNLTLNLDIIHIRTTQNGHLYLSGKHVAIDLFSLLAFRRTKCNK